MLFPTLALLGRPAEHLRAQRLSRRMNLPASLQRQPGCWHLRSVRPQRLCQRFRRGVQPRLRLEERLVLPSHHRTQRGQWGRLYRKAQVQPAHQPPPLRRWELQEEAGAPHPREGLEVVAQAFVEQLQLPRRHLHRAPSPAEESTRLLHFRARLRRGGAPHRLEERWPPSQQGV